MKKSRNVMKVPVSMTSRGPQPGRWRGSAGAATGRSAVRVVNCDLLAFGPGLRGRPGLAGDLPRKPPAGLAGDFVEEAEHSGQPAVAARDGDVEADDHGLRPGRCIGGAEAPGEPGLAVVGVHRVEQRECEAGELRLDGGDRRVDGGAPVRFGERVDVAGVRCPHLVDQLAAKLRVGLVPAGDVALDDVVHRGASLRCLSFGRHRYCVAATPLSITREVMAVLTRGSDPPEPPESMTSQVIDGRHGRNYARWNERCDCPLPAPPARW